MVISKATITDLSRITGYIAACSDHYPIKFNVHTQIETATRLRRVTKNLLKSKQLKEDIGLLYELALGRSVEMLERIRSGVVGVPLTEQIHTAYEEVETAIGEPWINQAKKKRRRCGANVSQELLRLWRNRKMLYNIMKSGTPEVINRRTRKHGQKRNSEKYNCRGSTSDARAK